MAFSPPIGDEYNLRQRYHNEIADFWRTGNFGQFVGKDNIAIHYCALVSSQNEKSLIIVPGRVEGYLKYKELTFDLFKQGFNVFIIDHRGQGISGRMLENRHKGYIKHFNDYVEDLHTFIEQVVLQYSQTAPYLLAHSMGGAIATRYLQRYPNTIKAAVLSSPMIAINSGALPKSVATLVIKMGYCLNKALGQEPWYFFGQSDYQVKPFEGNHLMHSDIRYTIFTQLYDQQSDLKLGGVTLKWLKEALKVEQDIFADVDKITTPTTIMQAGGDSIVDNQAQTLFCQQLHQQNNQCCPEGKPFLIADALHELFFEKDQYREPALQYALQWFAQH